MAIRSGGGLFPVFSHKLLANDVPDSPVDRPCVPPEPLHCRVVVCGSAVHRLSQLRMRRLFLLCQAHGLPLGFAGRVLMFNAKEAFYKCQHKITHTLIDFHEVD